MAIRIEHRVPALIRGLGTFTGAYGHGADEAEMARYQQQQRQYDQMLDIGVGAAQGISQAYQRRRLLDLSYQRQQSLSQMADAKNQFKQLADFLGLDFGINQDVLKPIAMAMNAAFRSYMDPNSSDNVKIQAIQTAQETIAKAQTFATDIRAKEPQLSDMLDNLRVRDKETGLWATYTPRGGLRYLDPEQQSQPPAYKALGYKTHEEFWATALDKVRENRMQRGTDEAAQPIMTTEVIAEMARMRKAEGPEALDAYLQGPEAYQTYLKSAGLLDEAPETMPGAVGAIPTAKPSIAGRLRRGYDAAVQIPIAAGMAVSAGAGRVPAQAVQVGGYTQAGGEAAQDVFTAPVTPPAAAPAAPGAAEAKARQASQPPTAVQVQAERAVYQAFSELDAIAAQEGTDDPTQWSDQTRRTASVVAMRLKEALKVRYPDPNTVPIGFLNRLAAYRRAGMIQ